LVAATSDCFYGDKKRRKGRSVTDINKLLAQSRSVRMTDAQRQQQRESFAYGNANIENQDVTREMIRESAERIERPQRRGK